MTIPTIMVMSTYADGKVRRIHEGMDIVCQEYIDGAWVEFKRTNEMSNDYAYLDTKNACYAREKQLKGHL